MWIDTNDCAKSWHQVDISGVVYHHDGGQCDETEYGRNDEEDAEV